MALSATPLAASEKGPRPNVTTIFNRILRRIHDGGLRPGTIVRDTEIARSLGVSRTPVREAFQLLREAGVIEVSAGRYTKIARPSATQTAQAAAAWLPLQQAVLEAIIASPEPADEAQIERLEALHSEALSAVIAFDNPRLAAANAELFSVTAEMADNPFLVRAIGSVVHALRLGLLSLDQPIDFPALLHAQRAMIDAITQKDMDTAEEAMSILRSIQIPDA